ncbi:hypothetical protein HOLleu_09781 [Holothuria leucospilota]|uniref:Uncharacterized protein n=1 Tax=Holothuria leucospilota TaxID=206669 RepID=A0A9Q1HED8_HOLLE|nr:hypothetical protein HOLleu_09781 [Holothuria leucospilota]
MGGARQTIPEAFGVVPHQIPCGTNHRRRSYRGAGGCISQRKISVKIRAVCREFFRHLLKEQ